jgi:hypothetical protein
VRCLSVRTQASTNIQLFTTNAAHSSTYVPLFRGSFVTIQQTPNVPGAAWRAILNRESQEAFSSAFVIDPVLVASVANAAVYGAAAIRAFFKASAAIYETLAFTTEARLGHRTFLEWKGSALGGKAIEGITIITDDASGLIERIELYHRPLAIVLAFASELEHTLGETLGAKLFARARQFS